MSAITQECRACGGPLRLVCACDEPEAVHFCDQDTDAMAKFFAAIALDGDRRDREERANPSSRCYLGYDWFMWPQVGRAIAELDGEAGERARSVVLQIYHGMLTQIAKRVGDWRRSMPDLIEECARERGAVR